MGVAGARTGRAMRFIHVTLVSRSARQDEVVHRPLENVPPAPGPRAGSAPAAAPRLTQYAHGGGCACKIPPGELEDVLRGLSGGGLSGGAASDLLVGLDGGDDAAGVAGRDGLAVVATADFFTPVVDDPYDWGRIAAANALSDVYAMGGRPLVAVNLLAWPREVLPFDLAAEVLRGGLDVARAAGC